MSRADQLCERCGNPPKDPNKRLEGHHPLPRRHYGEGSANQRVVYLCPDCHKEADRVAWEISQEMYRENREYFLYAFKAFMDRARPKLRIVR